MHNRLLLVVAAVGIVAAVVVLWVVRQGTHPVPVPPVTPMPTPTAAAGTPSPAAAFTPTPEAMVERHRTIVLSWGNEPTPTPTPPELEEEPAPRPGPSPTPDVSECVTAQSSASMLASAPGQVLVDIRATNRCGRDLGPLEVWFWVGGYRQGELVQSVRGHPFDPIPRDGEAEIHIGLPGSIDWYDQIEVRVIRPDAS